MITTKDIISKVDASRDKALAFLQAAIQTPSVTGDELAMARLVTAKFEEAGFEPRWHEREEGRPNVVTEWQGSQPGRRFVFNGHMDVFPPVEGDPGTYGPWAGTVVDGYLYGRGSVDMKSGLCAHIMAMKLLKEMGFDPKGSVLSTCVVDEEYDGYAGTKYLVEQGLVRGDFGIDPEPTNGRMLTQHGGVIRAKVTYRSEAWHTSLPHPSIPALDKALAAVERLRAYAARLKRYDEASNAWSLLSITEIEAGAGGGMYPPAASFLLDRRLVPGEDIDEEDAKIRAILDGLKQEDPRYSYEYEVTVWQKCLVVDDDAEIASIGRAAYKEVTGKDCPVYKRGGSSDAAVITLDAGVPMPNFGPGDDVNESTTANEKLWLEDYFDFIKVYMLMLVKALG